MNIEVEIKAWVDDFDSTLKLLNDNFSFVKEYLKEDIYLEGIDSLSGEKKEIRIRKVGSEFIVTYKERKRVNKVEVNNEVEFSVDNKENFLYVVNQLGYKEFMTKRKEGFHFKYENINLELSHVAGLGDFIEIESITDDESLVDSETEKIYSLLDQLKINRSRIEDRYYIEMLS